MRHPALFVLGWSVLLSACGGLRHETASLALTGQCPRLTTASLSAAQNQYGTASDTHGLNCALEFLRNNPDSALRRTALGSRLCLHLAERETETVRREQLAAEGVKFAETALALGADADGAVHYYLATNLGLAVREHITLAVENLNRLETEMKRAVALSPDIDDGGPLRVLGTLYLKAPAWPKGIGDVDKAQALLAQAAERHPGHPLNHLFYAQALWQADDKAAMSQAKTEYVKGLKLLREGQWGHSKQPWQKEFDEFGQEIGWAGIVGQAPIARTP